MKFDNTEVAVLIPCYNESLTILKVINDFKNALPDAKIYVYDNNSTDNTAEIAEKAGAIVRKEYKQGKSYVIRSMFSQIEADVYLMADGDDTYPADCALELIMPIIEGKAEMVIGDRLSNGSYEKENKRLCHNFGNKLVKFFVNYIFNGDIKDIMTGYRAFSRKFVKNFPVMSCGFELETEMSIHALDKRLSILQIPVNYKNRQEGSISKLNTYADGVKVLLTIFNLFKNYRPLMFFTLISLFLFFLGLAAGIPSIKDYIEIRYVTHVPLAILASGLEIMAVLSLICGLILDTFTQADKRNYEWKLIQYETYGNKNKSAANF